MIESGGDLTLGHSTQLQDDGETMHTCWSGATTGCEMDRRPSHFRGPGSGLAYIYTSGQNITWRDVIWSKNSPVKTVRGNMRWTMMTNVVGACSQEEIYAVATLHTYLSNTPSFLPFTSQFPSIPPLFPFIPTLFQTPTPPLRPLPQHILLDLPGTRLRQLVHNLHLPGHHKPANPGMFLGILDDVLPCQALPLLHRNERLRALSPVRVCYRDDAALEDVRVGHD